MSWSMKLFSSKTIVCRSVVCRRLLRISFNCKLIVNFCSGWIREWRKRRCYRDLFLWFDICCHRRKTVNSGACWWCWSSSLSNQFNVKWKEMIWVCFSFFVRKQIFLINNGPAKNKVLSLFHHHSFVKFYVRCHKQKKKHLLYKVMILSSRWSI